MEEQKQKSQMSYDTKTLITILLLIFVYPVGIIMMFVWMKWPWWVKLLCVLFFIIPALVLLSVLGIFAAAVLMTLNPSAQIAKAKEAKMVSDSGYIVSAVRSYYVENSKTPWGGKIAGEYKTNDAVNEKWVDELIDKKYLSPSFKLNQAVRYRLESNAKLENLKVCFDSLVNKGQEVCVPEK